MYPNSLLFGGISTVILLGGMALGVLLALKRGFFPSLIRLGMIIACALIALPLATVLARAMSGVSENIMSALLGNSCDQIARHSPTTMELLHHLPIALIAPTLFVSIFLLLKWLTLIVFHLIKAILPSRSSLLFRVLGGVAGALGSLICVLVILIPTWGMAGIAHRAAQTLCAADTSQNEQLTQTINTIEKFDQKALLPTVDNFAAKLFTNQGDSAVYRTLTKFEMNGETLVLGDELDGLMQTASDAVTLADTMPSDFRIADLSDTQIDAMHTLVDDIDDSDLLRKIGAEWISAMATTWHNGETFLGISAPAADTSLAPVLHSLYGFLATTNETLLADDLDTFIDIFELLVEHRVLGGGDMLNTFADQAFITSLAATIDAHTRLRTSVTELVVSLTGAWSRGEAYEGAAKPVVTASVAPIMDTVYGFFSTTDETLLSGDLSALSDLLGVCGDHNILDGSAALTDMLLDAGFLADLNTVLAQHDRFRAYFADWLASLTSAWAEGKAYNGVEAPQYNTVLTPVTNALYSILATTNGDLIVSDFETLIEISNVMTTYGLFHDSITEAQMAKTVMESSLVSDLNAIIGQNERFRPLLDAVTGLGLSVISGKLEAALPQSETMTSMSSGISAALNEVLSQSSEEQMTVVAKEVDKVLADNKIEVPDGVSDMIAQTIINEFGSTQSVTEQEVTDYLLGLYDAVGNLDDFFK